MDFHYLVCKNIKLDKTNKIILIVFNYNYLATKNPNSESVFQ